MTNMCDHDDHVAAAWLRNILQWHVVATTCEIM